MTQEVFAGLAAAVFFMAGSAFAQAQPNQPGVSTGVATQDGVTTGAGSFPVGPLVVYPGINLAIGHDDNLLLSPTAPKSSTYTILSPHIRAEARPGPHKFDIELRIDDGQYWSSSADNYTNYSLLGNGDVVFSARAGLKLRAEYLRGHDGRGTTDAAPTATPNQYNNYGVAGVFHYGAPGARGRIEIDAGAYRRRYTNNPSVTDSINHDTSQVGGTFFWRVMPRTELLFQTQHRNIDYQLTTSTQDSTENRYLVGVKWEATAKTTGYAKFGRMDKKFDSAARTDVSSSSAWDVGVRWSPLTYSVVDFVTAKQTSETTGVGDAIVGKNYGVTWSHAWSSRLRTQALATYRTDTFTNTAPSRVDDTFSLGFRLAYDFRRWLRLGAEYTHFNRDSSLDIYNYKRNLFLLTVGATL